MLRSSICSKALLLGILCSFIQPSLHAQCVDYREFVHWVGKVGILADGWDVAVAGDYAYVAERGYGLEVVDISDPTSPNVVGLLNPPGYAYGIALVGDFAYVVGGLGLHVVDIKNPAAPKIVGHVSQPPYGSGAVAVADGYAYVPDGYGLQVIDVSDPASPRWIAEVLGYGSADVALKGHYAYVPADDGLRVVDITDPPAAHVVATLAIQRGLIAITGDYACMTGSSKVTIVDITDPLSPTVVGNVQFTGSIWDITAEGSHVLIANGEVGLLTIDISNPMQPQIVGRVDTPGVVWSVAIGENRAFVGDVRTLHVLDVAEAGSPAPVGSLDELNEGEAVMVAGNDAFVATGGTGLLRIDVTDPASPKVRATAETSGYALDVDLEDGLACVADGDSGVLVFDADDPSEFHVLGTLPIAGSARSIVADGAYAYVAAGSAGLAVLDLTDPTLPREIGAVDTPGYALDVEKSGSTACIADAAFGIQLIDLTDPKVPRVAGTLPLPELAWDVAFRGDRVYVACRGGGMQVVDVSNPASPLVVGSVAANDVWAVAISEDGDYVYLSDEIGVLVVDVAGSVPSIIGYLDVPGVPRALTAAGDAIYVAGEDRFRVLPAQCSGAETSRRLPSRAMAHLSPIWPNPCRGNATLGIDLAMSMVARLTLYDASGRLIRTLASERLPAGRHSFSWNGRDGNGREVPNGIYFAALSTGFEVVAARVTLVR